MEKKPTDKETIIGVSSLNYKDNKSMDLKRAELEATKLANLTGVNHVIVPVGNSYSVYSEKEYPSGYLTLVNPEIKIESTIVDEIEHPKEKKQLKKQSNAVSEA